MKLTVNILTQNNEKTIENTLESIASLNCNLLIGDVNSSDATIKICKKYKNVKILNLGNIKDKSKLKNTMIKESKDSWLLFIEPWEWLLSPADKIKEILSNEAKSYKINIIQNDLVIKQTRIWHKDQNIVFKYPIFETLDDKNSNFSDIYFASSGKKEESDSLTIIEKWRDLKPLSCEPIYYLAFYYLEKKEWKKFLNYANNYLHKEKANNISLIMTHYYCSMVKCYIDSEKNLKESIHHILYCLAEKPLMAEFWCLLGDIYYSSNEYNKAINFYENAKILGSKRLKNDEWPIEISKYKKYPEEMIENCLKVQENTRNFASSREN